MENVVFVEQVPNDLYCPLCLDVLTEPYLTSCGHLFCNRCVTPLVADKKPCPVCREVGYEVMRNLAVERKINAMKVYCSFRDQGCDWIGPRGGLDEHTKTVCDFSSFPCLFQKFGCSKRLPHTDVEMHLKSNLAEHMSMVIKAMDTQREVMVASVAGKDQKLKSLEQRLQLLEKKYGNKLEQKSDITWHPLPIADYTHIGKFYNSVPNGHTYKFQLPMDLIPINSREILLHVSIRSGHTLPHSDVRWLTVYVKDGGKKLYKMTRITTCKQDAFSDNSENMWFPMPADHSVYLEVAHRPKPIQKNATCDIYVIGYRHS